MVIKIKNPDARASGITGAAITIATLRSCIGPNYIVGTRGKSLSLFVFQYGHIIDDDHYPGGHAFGLVQLFLADHGSDVDKGVSDDHAAPFSLNHEAERRRYFSLPD